MPTPERHAEMAAAIARAEAEDTKRTADLRRYIASVSEEAERIEARIAEDTEDLAECRRAIEAARRALDEVE